jgi:hypothetical protein
MDFEKFIAIISLIAIVFVVLYVGQKIADKRDRK